MPASSSSGGGGSSARNIRAGGAEYELKLKDEVTGNLAKIQTGVQNFTKRFKQFTAPLAGALGQIFEAGSRGGALGVGIAAGQKLLEGVTDEIAEWAFGTETFRKKLEASVAEMRRMVTHAAEATAEMREWFGAAVDPGEKVRLLGEEIKRQEKLYHESARRIADAERAVEDAPSWVTGRKDKSIAAAKAAAEAHTAEQNKAAAALRALSKERDRLLDPTTDPGFTGPIAKMRRQLENELRFGNLEGMSRQIEEMLRDVTATPDVIGQLTALRLTSEFVDQEKKIRAAVKGLEDYVKAAALAERQSEMSAHEVAIMNAELAGVRGGALADARRALLSGGGVGQLLGSFLATLPAIGQAIKNMPHTTSLGGFVAPGGGVAAQMFGGAGGAMARDIADLKAGKGGLADAIGESTADYLARKLRLK